MPEAFDARSLLKLLHKLERWLCESWRLRRKTSRVLWTEKYERHIPVDISLNYTSSQITEKVKEAREEIQEEFNVKETELLEREREYKAEVVSAHLRRLLFSGSANVLLYEANALWPLRSRLLSLLHTCLPTLQYFCLWLHLRLLLAFWHHSSCHCS